MRDGTKPLRVGVRLDGRAPRRWHLRLLEALAALPGLDLFVARSPGPGGLPANAALLFAVEARLRRLPGDGPAAPVPLAALAAYPDFGPVDLGQPGLVLDLCGDVAPAPGLRVWRLTFDGTCGEAGLLASLLAGRTPVAALVEGERVVAAGRLGTESLTVMRAAFEDGLVRTVDLIRSALVGEGIGEGAGACGWPVCADAPPPISLSRATIGLRAVTILARTVAARLHRLGYRTPHWRVGWRHLAGPDLIDLRRLPDHGWHDLPDDGLRFYADPFPIVHGGRTILFVEEYPHATGRGVISAVAFGPDGPEGVPVPVLEEPHHLSYPFVFERDGAHWMIPESGAAGTVDLYRATAFPGGWVKQATLISGVTASDATLLEHGGRWWLFATVREQGFGQPERAARGAYSDALHLWSAPDFRGPWTPHPRNPVLIDFAAARPAGRIVARDGALIRPVQDCRRGYGAALALARIDRLDEGGYAQTVETTLRAGPGFPGSRLHTLNRTAAFEFIDGSGSSPRYWRRRPYS
jgi:hypothetical protein